MNVFDIRNNVVDNYAEYMKSFVRISDPEIKAYVEDHLSRGGLWPHPIVRDGGRIDELLASDTARYLYRQQDHDEHRAHLRAELDGIYAHLYGLSRDDFAYILGTFPIVERNDIKAHGEFRTKRFCLEAYDRFANDPAVVAARPEVGAV